MWLLLVIAGAVRPTPRQVCQASRCDSYPTFLRLLRRLAVDRASQRVCAYGWGLLLAYLAMPIDLIPDFIPVIGYADDAIIVTIALRSVARRMGIDELRRHRPGTEDGLADLCRLTGSRCPQRDSCAERGAPKVVAVDLPVRSSRF